MLLSIDKFGGEVPKLLNPVLLPPNKSQFALNCVFDQGGLVPLLNDTLILTLPTTDMFVSAYLYEDEGTDYFFAWDTDVDAIKVPLASDSYNRVFYAEAGALKVTAHGLFTHDSMGAGVSTYPGSYYLPCPPAPPSPPSVSGSAYGTDPTLIETRGYVYTFVNSYGEEGPPSDVSNLIDVYDGNTVTVIGLEPGGTNRKLLLHFDGNPGDDIEDSSLSDRGDATKYASADIQTASVKFGTGALRTYGNGYISYPDSADFFNGTSNFTIDLWIQENQITTGKEGVFQQYVDDSNYVQCWIEGFSNYYTVNFEILSSADVQVSGSTFLESVIHPSGGPASSALKGSFQHIAIIRGWNGDNDTLAIVANGYGSQFTFGNAKTWPDLSAAFEIGRITRASVDYIGDLNFDEVSVIKGIPAWQANFTPPAIAYTDTSGGDENYDIYALISKRIYRLNQSASGAQYQLVVELPFTETTFSDSVLDASLGEILPSLEWDSAPVGIQGIISLPNGFLAGFFDNCLCFSVPNYPHAWPLSYRKRTEKDIVSIGAFGSAVVVLTKGQPYLCVGNDPSNMVMEKVDPGLSCLSKRGKVQVGELVVYPSPEGITAIGPNGSEVLSLEILTPDQWVETYNPSTMSAFYWQGNYISFYTTDTVSAGIFFDIKNKDFVELDFYATGGHYDKESGVLYLIIDGEIVSFSDASSFRNFDYKSRRFRFSPSSLGVIKVLSNATNDVVAVDVIYPEIPFTDTLLVISDEVQRLEHMGLVGSCEVRVFGDVDVTAIFLASTMEELIL